MIRCCLLIAYVAITCLSGCVNPRPYFDPTQPRVGYDAIQKRETPTRVRLVTEYRRDGQPVTVLSLGIQATVAEVLTKSGVFSVVDAGDSDGQLAVTLNETFDNNMTTGTAAAVGLTLGLVGTTGARHFEMDLMFRGHAGHKSAQVRGLRQTVYVARGATSAVPDGAEVIGQTEQVTERVIERLVLRALDSMGRTRELP